MPTPGSASVLAGIRGLAGALGPAWLSWSLDMKLNISFGTPAQRLARWERLQKAGMLRFVLTRGLLFGIMFGVGVCLVSPPPQPWYSFVADVFVMSLAWAIAMWFVTMWQYRRAQKQK